MAREAEWDRHDRDVVQAWQTAALHRAKKLPPLQTLLSKRGKPIRQTVAQQRSALHSLSAMYGGAVRRGKTKGR